MSDYKKAQHHLINSIEERFQKGLFPSTIFDMVDDYEADNRLGLTSVIFVPDEIQKEIIRKVVEPIKKTDRNQYFYPPPNSLHITIFCIRCIHISPTYTEKDIEVTKKIFSEVIPKHPEFSFELRGLFNLPTSLGIRAYADEAYRELILELSAKTQEAGIATDKKLASNEIFFSNLTICRHRQKPNQAYYDAVEKYKEVSIGKITAKDVHLAISNVTFQKDKTQILETYHLG